MKLIDKKKYKPITLNLNYKIPADVDLSYINSPETLPILSYITLNHILYPKERYFILPSRFLILTFGRNYYQGLKELIFHHIIDRKVICDKTGHYYSAENKICASYRLISRHLKSIKAKKYKYLPVCVKYLAPKPKKGKFCSVNKTACPKLLKILDSYAGITLDSSWINYFSNDEKYPSNHFKYPSEPIAQHGIFVHSRYIVEGVLRKKISVSSETDCGRVFHPLILITRGLREYFRKYGEKIVNIDAKSFHPFLIASCISDLSLREKYIEIVMKGFYELFSNKEYSRDVIKVSLQKYLSGIYSRDFKALEIARWYEENFPEVPRKMMELKEKKITFQMYLQQLEASIFVDEVFMKFPFFSLPMHDGLCVLQKDVNAACEFIGNACESRLGYRIPLKSH